MNYAQHIENYRRQLLTNVSYQNTRWFVWGTPAKMAFRDKLLRYAKKAGIDHLNAEVDEVVIPGILGTRRRTQIGDENRVQSSRKADKIFRRGYMLDNELVSLKYKLMAYGAMPMEPIGAFSVPDFQEAILIRNRNRGELHILDNERTVKVIPWVSVEGVSEEAFYEAWGGIEIELVSFLGGDKRPIKAMFRKGRKLSTVAA